MATKTTPTPPKAIGITATWQDWYEALKRATATIGGRPILPVLAGAYISKQDGEVTVRGADLDVWTETVLPGAYMDSSEPLLVNARQLAAALTGVRGQLTPAKARCERVVVQSHVTGAVTVSGFGRDLRLTDAMVDVADYPAWPAPLEQKVAHLSPGDFVHGFAFARTAAGKDATLPMLTGVRIESQAEGGFTFIGTDRYRLAVIGVGAAATEPFEVLVPSAAWSVLKGLTGAIDVYLDPAKKDRIVLRSGHTTVDVRTMDATFPPYRSLIPSEASSWVIERSELLGDVLAAASVLDRAPVRIELGRDKYQVQDSEIRGSLTSDTDGWKAAFNGAFLIDGLRAFTSTEVQLGGTGPNKPHVLRGQRHTFEATYLIMPTRLPG